MGLFDFFKKDRGYDIHSLEFCEVGKDGKRETLPSLKLYTDSRYIMPVVKMTSRIDRTVKMKVRITEPNSKVHVYDFDAPLTPAENISAQLPWWGSEKRDYFTTVGTWQFDVLDEDDQVVISAPLEIASLDDIWEDTGWIHVISHLEFRNIDYHNNAIDDWGTKSFVEPQYIQMRCGYTCYSKVERKVSYHVEIVHEQTGRTKSFDYTATLDPRDGWLQMCGWGSQSGTSYSPGSYIYTLSYKGKRLASGRFEVAKSPRQQGWIEPEALVLYFYNTDDELKLWVAYDCGMNLDLAKGELIKQQTFKANAYKKAVAGFQWRSLEKGHRLKLTFKFYMDGRLVYSNSSHVVTHDPDLTKQDIFEQDFEVSGSMRLEDSNGELHPFPAGRYQVKVYLETRELAEHLVMQQTIDLMK